MEVRVDSDIELWLEAGSADVSPFQTGSHRRSVNDFLPLVAAPPPTPTRFMLFVEHKLKRACELNKAR